MTKIQYWVKPDIFKYARHSFATLSWCQLHATAHNSENLSFGECATSNTRDNVSCRRNKHGAGASRLCTGPETTPNGEPPKTIVEDRDMRALCLTPQMKTTAASTDFNIDISRQLCSAQPAPQGHAMHDFHMAPVATNTLRCRLNPTPTLAGSPEQWHVHWRPPLSLDRAVQLCFSRDCPDTTHQITEETTARASRDGAVCVEGDQLRHLRAARCRDGLGTHILFNIPAVIQIAKKNTSPKTLSSKTIFIQP